MGKKTKTNRRTFGVSFGNQSIWAGNMQERFITKNLYFIHSFKLHWFTWILKDWLEHKFLTGEGGAKGASMNFQGGTSPYAPYNMESLIDKFANKYICFHSLFNVRGCLKQRTTNQRRRSRKKVKNHWITVCEKLTIYLFGFWPLENQVH